MSEIWVWRSWIGVDEASVPTDFTGFSVETTNGHIGDVDEANFDEGTGSLIVDTGFWIFGKKRMVPVGMIERIDPEKRVLYLSCTKDEVKAAPDYDPERADKHRQEVGDYFDSTRQVSSRRSGPSV